MNTITVCQHTRKKPDKKPDPLAPMIEARRAILEKRWAPALAQKQVNEYRQKIGYRSPTLQMLFGWWRK